MPGEFHWLNHILFSPDARRFVFLHRWWRAKNRLGTQMFTADLDGGNCCLMPIEDASHFIWYDNTHILSWDSRPPGQQSGYYIAQDQSSRSEIIGPDVLVTDGHMTVSPDHRWILTDTYPDERGYRDLLLYRIADGGVVKLGQFLSPLPEPVELRCDLHPRWNRTGTAVSIDSDHEGARRIYLLDVSSVVT